MPKISGNTAPSQADSIVVGGFVSGTQTGKVVSAVLKAERTFKGNVSAGQLLNVQTTIAFPVRGAEQVQNDHGIWFLKGSSPGPWTILAVNPIRGSATPLDSMCYPTPANSVPTQSTLFSAASPPVVSDLIVIELVPALLQTFPSTWMFDHLASGLLTMPSSDVLSQFEIMASSPIPEIRLVALAGLIRRGKNNHLTDILSLPPGTKGLVAAELVAGLSNVSDPAPGTIEALGNIVANSTWQTSFVAAAATALANIHSAGTLPILAKLLDNSDPKLQRIAISGFSMFVNNFPIKTGEGVVNFSWRRPVGPTPSKTAETDKYSMLFGESPGSLDVYVVFWKHWYETRRSQ